jgi:hypothetical protein
VNKQSKLCTRFLYILISRLRVENMERQLANLTGLVQKALTQTPTTHLQVPGRENYRTGI